MGHPGVSIILPTVRTGSTSLPAIRSVCLSLASFGARTGAPHELVLFVDRKLEVEDSLLDLADEFSFIRLVLNPQPKEWRMGAPHARARAIQASRFPILLFTDDDCRVPLDWAEKLARGALEYGVVGGGVRCSERERKKSVYARIESFIDAYRLVARDSQGGRKFISFPCLGVLRSKLSPVAFDTFFVDSADDMDLGCRLRLNGDSLHILEDLFVETQYEKSLLRILRRKLRHAKGIAFVHRRLGDEQWKKLEMGSHVAILSRWTRISFGAPLPLRERFLFWFVNMTYALGLLYYFRLLSDIEPADLLEIIRLPAPSISAQDVVLQSSEVTL